MTQVDNNTESHKGTHLTLGEMHKIEGYKAEKHSNRKIARLLGRSPQAINDAIKKGSIVQKRQQVQNGKTYTYYDKVYSADVHWKKYEQNRINSGRRPKWVELDKFIDWADKKNAEK